MEVKSFPGFSCNPEDLKNTLLSNFTQDLDRIIAESQVSKRSWAIQQLSHLFNKFLKDQPIQSSEYQNKSWIKTHAIQDQFLILRSMARQVEMAASALSLFSNHNSDEACHQDNMSEMQAVFTDVHMEMKKRVEAKLIELTALHDLQREERENTIKKQKEIDEQAGDDYKKRLSGELWECIGRRLFQFDEQSKPCGYLYQFSIKQEYDEFSFHPDLLPVRSKEANKKKSEIHPALEPTSHQVVFTFGCREDILRQIFAYQIARQDLSSSEKQLRFDEAMSVECHMPEVIAEMDLKLSSLPNPKYLNEIGYRCFVNEENRLILELPDLEALLDGWRSLQRKYPEKDLPDLDVVSSEGIADDLSFVQAYLDHDALLSNGKEFVHDHYSHIKTRLRRMLKGRESYLEEKERLCKLLEIPYQAIHRAKEEEAKRGIGGMVHKEWEKLECMIGIFADMVFSYEKDEDVIEVCEGRFIEEVPSHLSPTYNPYLKRRFGDAVDVDVMGYIWKKCIRSI